MCLEGPDLDGTMRASIVEVSIDGSGARAFASGITTESRREPIFEPTLQPFLTPTLGPILDPFVANFEEPISTESIPIWSWTECPWTVDPFQ